MTRFSCLALSLALVLPLPGLAEGLRPLPRPAAVEIAAAFAGASDLAPRQVPRPQRRPGAELVERPMAAKAEVPEVPATLRAAAPRVVRSGPVQVQASAPVVRSGPVQLADLGQTRGVTIGFSAANARVPVFVTAAVTATRPVHRPEALAAPAAIAQPAVMDLATPRPRARPAVLAAPPPAEVVKAAAFASPRPAMRPKGLAARKAPAAEPEARIVKTAAAPRINPGEALVVPKGDAKGALCGDPRIKGSRLPPISSKVQGCGVADPVRVTEVDGVRLSTPATLDCDTARALRQWVTTGLKPAVGRVGVSELKIAAHYSCRPRNNVKGARISEHGRGKAIDIAGIVTAKGNLLTVLGDYRSSDVLKQVRKAACGIFGTTLGPGSDRYHNDHFHFDTARHRNGAYCR